MPTPNFQAAGNQQASRAALTGITAVAWPTHVAGDIGLLVIETSGNGTTVDITTPTGWQAVPGSPVTDLATAAGSKLQVWWKRAASASEGAVTVPDSGDHQVARLFTFRNCIATGDPWDVTPTVADTLIVMIVSRPNDNASNLHFGVPVNANLTDLGECGEAGTAMANGGGLVVSYGVKATAGNTGTSTLSKIASTTDAYMVIALKGEPTLTRYVLVT